ncbi:D-isomer specific 2-hydroxyacid dehydrogenase family protein [Streptomyces sp. SD15]
MNTAIAVEPSTSAEEADQRANDPGLAELRLQVEAAVLKGGGRVTSAKEADGVVWLDQGDVAELRTLLDEHPSIRWVQLPWAGVEKFASDGLMDRPVAFTCAKGLFADQVAEHALMLVLASLRHLAEQARTPRWHSLDPCSLFGRRVTILGGGGTAAALIRLLRPFGCKVRVLRRAAEAVAGADETLPSSELQRVLPDTDVLVLALSLTPRTRHIIGARELSALPTHAIVVNVARGSHIHTDALVAALENRSIAAAAVDVTDPEPLPEGHPLWGHPRALVTSHCADSADYVLRMLSERVARNVANLREGNTLEGLVDPRQGY